MNRIVSALAAACCALLFAAAPATALTFKKGEVLGPDGTMYQGPSPEERERLIKKAAEDGETAAADAFGESWESKQRRVQAVSPFGKQVRPGADVGTHTGIGQREKES